jgi:cbb3-type cytochrome oxidase maturation protein
MIEKYICLLNISQRMSVLILLIACSILIAGGFLIAFIWSVKKGQYDDDYTPSVRILFDDRPISEGKTTLTPNKNKVHASTGKISV